MALSVVQAQTAQLTGAGTVTTPAVTTTAGNLLVVGCVEFTGGFTTTAISDSKTNTWTKASVNTVSSGGEQMEVYYCFNCLGGASHTFSVATQNSGTGPAVAVIEISGADATSAVFDKQAIAAVASSTTPTGTATAATTQADEIVVGFMSHDDANDTTGAGTGYALPTNGAKNDGSSASPVAVVYKIVAATGTQAAAFTLASAATSVVGTSTYKQAAAGGAVANSGYVRSLNRVR